MEHPPLQIFKGIDGQGKPPVSKRDNTNSALSLVGQVLRAKRKAHRYSIRKLAQLSGLSVNTLSLIENGKTSPSVSTLYQLAESLEIPITAFFESEVHENRVIYQKSGQRRQIVFSKGKLEKIYGGTSNNQAEPFITWLEPGANSGQTLIVLPAREFIYCLEGHITYLIDGQAYPLAPGDSLIFESYTPHSWSNTAATNSKALLVLCPDDSQADSLERYFIP